MRKYVVSTRRVTRFSTCILGKINSYDNNANNNNTKANEENENDANARIESNSKLAPNLPPPPQPRAVSRSAMVKAVVASETQEELVEKPVKNVCLVDKPQIFPSGNSLTTRAVIGELFRLG